MRYAVAVVASLVALVPAAGHSLTSERVAIIAIGDYGVGGERQRLFGQAVRRFEARNRADALVTLGDNDYTESPSLFEASWEASFGWARRRGIRVAGVLGNHDVRVDGGRYQYAALSMPHRFYRRRVGAVELFLLDSTRIDPEQTRWLARALAASKARWKIAAFHHPAYTCGGYDSHPEVVLRWVPFFERRGVRLVLSGHDHNYQRFGPRRGVRYVVHGGGGARLYPVKPCPAAYPRRLRARVEHGFVYLLIRGNRLDGWSVASGGRRTDHFVLSVAG